MIKRHITFYTNELKPLNYCGKVIGYEAAVSSFELPFEVEPTKGEHDFNKCEGCQRNLKVLTANFTEKFNGNKDKKGFPFCCSNHSNLLKFKEFNRVDFVNVPEMAARKIIYANQHIINNYNSENWYRVITDYIDVLFQSFGQMPKGYGEPFLLGNFLNRITDAVNKNKEIPTEKKTRILEFLNSYNTPAKEQQTDLNILLGIYEKWLKEFPFDLNSYFGNLKPHFEKQMLIFKGKPEKNMFSGITKIKMHTKSSLFEALVDLTNELLTKINGASLYEKGFITDANKIKLELAISSRKLKLKQGYKNSSPNEEQRYRRMLKDWFNDEKKFIDELTPLFKPVTPQQTPEQPKAPVIALFCSWVNFAKVLPKEENEGVENYCKKVCEKFNLPYSDRIRQNFNNNGTKANKEKVKELILPSIDKESSKKINEYLGNKDQPKQKLYA